MLYGDPLLEFIARECFEAFAGVPLPPDDDSDSARQACDDERERVREIHARWLTTPRDDLHGRAPRDLLLADKEHIGANLQHRADQWSHTGACPPGLDPASAAYRLGGFGTHEIVTYYDTVRTLLWSCRGSAAELPRTGPAAVYSPGEFVPSEVRRLTAARERWLDTPDPEFHGRTPRSIIHNERARIPEGVSGAEAMIDCDCPLCLMMADDPGPVFWHLDGCNMDDDFAFSFHRTREEWEAEQREYEEFSRRCDDARAAREASGGEADSVGRTSFSAPDSPEAPPTLRLFAVASHLAELIDDLKSSPDGRELTDRLNRSFGNLREVVGASHSEPADALLAPVTDHLCDALDAVSATRPDLEPKCADLQRRVRRFAEPTPPTWGDDFDDDLPF